MGKIYSNCQSCGMPLKRDVNGGGTNADGTRSSMYCSNCFKDGKYTLPEITENEMKELVKTKLKEFGFPGFLAGIYTRHIPDLERWKNHDR